MTEAKLCLDAYLLDVDLSNRKPIVTQNIFTWKIQKAAKVKWCRDKKLNLQLEEKRSSK